MRATGAPLSLVCRTLGVSRAGFYKWQHSSVPTLPRQALRKLRLHTEGKTRLPPGEYDVVVANILSQPLILLEPLLAVSVLVVGCSDELISLGGRRPEAPAGRRFMGAIANCRLAPPCKNNTR